MLAAAPELSPPAAALATVGLPPPPGRLIGRTAGAGRGPAVARRGGRERRCDKPLLGAASAAPSAAASALAGAASAPAFMTTDARESARRADRDGVETARGGSVVLAVLARPGVACPKIARRRPLLGRDGAPDAPWAGPPPPAPPPLLFACARLCSSLKEAVAASACRSSLAFSSSMSGTTSARVEIRRRASSAGCSKGTHV